MGRDKPPKGPGGGRAQPSHRGNTAQAAAKKGGAPGQPAAAPADPPQPQWVRHRPPSGPRALCASLSFFRRHVLATASCEAPPSSDPAPAGVVGPRGDVARREPLGQANPEGNRPKVPVSATGRGGAGRTSADDGGNQPNAPDGPRPPRAGRAARRAAAGAPSSRGPGASWTRPTRPSVRPRAPPPEQRPSPPPGPLQGAPRPNAAGPLPPLPTSRRAVWALRREAPRPGNPRPGLPGRNPHAPTAALHTCPPRPPGHATSPPPRRPPPAPGPRDPRGARVQDERLHPHLRRRRARPPHPRRSDGAPPRGRTSLCAWLPSPPRIVLSASRAAESTRHVTKATSPLAPRSRHTAAVRQRGAVCQRLPGNREKGQREVPGTVGRARVHAHGDLRAPRGHRAQGRRGARGRGLRGLAAGRGG